MHFPVNGHSSMNVNNSNWIIIRLNFILNAIKKYINWQRQLTGEAFSYDESHKDGLYKTNLAHFCGRHQPQTLSEKKMSSWRNNLKLLRCQSPRSVFIPNAIILILQSALILITIDENWNLSRDSTIKNLLFQNSFPQRRNTNLKWIQYVFLITFFGKIIILCEQFGWISTCLTSEYRKCCFQNLENPKEDRNGHR